ncbi:glycosyltransferase family 4 protein [Thalassotalea nanhaiensis]|uniref:Glycosyltransferase family 4 protein n=1 Tax=Thalassotalea nanhaiensis TaxID=3065648 RepID=A0ABY9TLM0_9GAMM|nr:glycosyltransferase family 4 protein [Colwelliaceae bacterium SQ345]
MSFEKNIRVLHILSSPSAGGAEVYVKDLISNLKVKGQNVALLFISTSEEVNRSPEYQKSFIEYLGNEDIPFYFLKSGGRRNLIIGAKSFKRAIQYFKPDIIHSHLLSGVIYSFLYARKIPLVYTHHNTVIDTNEVLFRMLMNACKGFIGISEVCTNYLKSYLPKEKPLKTIYNSVDQNRLILKDYKKQKNDFDVVEVLAVGRLQEQKNYPLLLDAINIVNEKTKYRFKVSIAGEGYPEIKQLIKNKIKEFNLSEVVYLLGNRTDIPKLMHDSDIFIMSSAWEGLPIALIEAQITGLPAIVTDVGGCKEVIERTKGGQVVEPDKPDALASALIQLIEDKKTRESQGESSQSNIEVFDINYSAQEHLEFYHFILSSNN